MEMRNVLVSICCITYNHEKYIRKCLDGFVSQRTNFSYEILVYDDASTDRTQDILKEFQMRYPEKFKLYLGEENQYKKGAKGKGGFRKALCPLTKGKYVAFCEGDDYWTDPYKLQKQVNALDHNPSCTFCAHRVTVENQNSKKSTFIPSFKLKSGVVSANQWREYLKYDMFVHTSSFMMKGDIARAYAEDKAGYIEKLPIGDLFFQLRCAEEGDMFFLDEVMSCYRLWTIGSWSNRTLEDINSRKMFFEKMIVAFQEYDEYTSYKYHDFFSERIKLSEINIFLADKEYSFLRNLDYKKAWRSLPKRRKIKVVAECAKKWMKI